MNVNTSSFLVTFASISNISERYQPFYSFAHREQILNSGGRHSIAAASKPGQQVNRSTGQQGLLR